MGSVNLFILFALLGVVRAVCPTVQYAGGTRFSASSFTAGQTITIAAGATYLFDLTNSPTYGNIYVSGTLVFADEKDVTLNAAYLMVRPGGKLIIGSCDCPFENKATLTFWGSDKTLNPDNFGTKGIAVSDGGTAHFYGKLFGPSWTTLAATANIGATQIVLSEAAQWKVGDRLAIASTDYQQNQAEVVNITAVISSTTFTIAPALKYMHHSGTYNGLEEKAEVARLNRNILIQGDPSSDTTRFGVHTIFANAFTEVRISGLEVNRGGQAGVLARYPIHFHFAEDVGSRAFLKDSVVHDTYQRCYTVHHTNSLLLQRNVGYNTKGHCFFLEDGIETNNKFYWNLGFKVAKPLDAERLIPSDTDPAVFWVTNPNNTYVNNVAAGGASHCWWLAFPVNPMGPSATPTVCPRRTPIQYFAHNKAHSCGQDGIHIDRGPDALGVPGGSALSFVWPDASGNNRWASVGSGYNPQANATGLDQPSQMVEAVINNFHAYRCQDRGSWTRNGMVTFYQPIYADNAIGITFATNGGYGKMFDGIFIGQTANKGTPESWENKGPDNRTLPMYGKKNYPIRGYEFYDGPNIANNVRCYAFTNNVDRTASCISMLRQDEFQISSTNEAENVLITDGSVPVSFPDWLHDGDRQSVFIDQDGSVSGRPPVGNQKVVVTNRAQFLKTASCIDNSATTGTMFCPNQYGRFGWNWDSAYDPLSWPDAATLATLDSLARLSRSDQAASIYMPVCGGACNAPNGSGDTRTLSTPRRSFQMTFPLAPVYPAVRDIMLNFMHSPPRQLKMRVTYTDAFYNPTTRNEVTVAICMGTSTRFYVDAANPATASGCQYGYANRDPVANAAPSLAAMRTNPVAVDFNNRGKNMWFLDTSSGYLYVRFAVLDNRTSANARDAYPATEVMFRFINVPSTRATCATLTGGSSADRGLPPIATVVAPPAFGPPSASVPRDDAGNLCSSATVSITTSAITTAAVTSATSDSTATATTAAASLTAISSLTTEEASVSLSTTAQSTTSVSLSTSTTSQASITSTALSASTIGVSTSNVVATSSAAAASTTANNAATTRASTTAATTRSVSTAAEATTVSAVADSTAQATLTASVTSAASVEGTSTTASTSAAATSLAGALAAASTTNAAATSSAAESVAASASAESATNAASATSIVSSTFVAATNAASTTTTTAATEAVSTTALATLTGSTAAAELTTSATATTGGNTQTFTVNLNECPASVSDYETQLAAGFGDYAGSVLGRPAAGDFRVTVACSSDGTAQAVVTYTGGDAGIVGVIVAAINDRSLQTDPNFTNSCSGACAANVASATSGSPRGGKKKSIPVYVWIIVAVVVVVVVAALIGAAVFFYCKTQKGGGGMQAPLRPMYNLDEMYAAKSSA